MTWKVRLLCHPQAVQGDPTPEAGPHVATPARPIPGYLVQEGGLGQGHLEVPGRLGVSGALMSLDNDVHVGWF